MVGVETLLGVATIEFDFPLLILSLFLACKLSLESLFSIEATTEPAVKLCKLFINLICYRTLYVL